MKFNIRRTFADGGKVKVEKSTINGSKNTSKTSFNKVSVKVPNSKMKARKILRQGPRPTLDLRRRPEREGTVKQHGFKEGEIGHGNLL